MDEEWTCEDHPNRMLEWDGFCWICPGCVLDMYFEEEVS